VGGKLSCVGVAVTGVVNLSRDVKDCAALNGQVHLSRTLRKQAGFIVKRPASL
jgi:hypothetical protein